MASAGAGAGAPDIFDISVRTIKGADIKFGDVARGKLVVVVNGAWARGERQRSCAAGVRQCGGDVCGTQSALLRAVAEQTSSPPSACLSVAFLLCLLAWRRACTPV